MKTALKIVGISIVALAVVGGAVYAMAEALEETETHNDTISRDVDHLVIKAEAGDIEVVPGGRSVQVQRTDSYVLDDPDVTRTLEDGVLTIEAECEGLSPMCTTDYRVEIPRGVTVEARTYVGDVDVDGIAAHRIEARAYVGDVHVDAARKGEVTARTNVGDVDVELPSGGYDELEAEADVGSVDVTRR